MSLLAYRFKKILLSLFLVALIYPGMASAGLGLLQGSKMNDIKGGSDELQKKAGFEAADRATLPTAVALVINVFIGLLGTIFLILIVISGWNWFTAQGDTKKIDTAKARMINATIGLIIVVSAYAITVFVFRTGDELQLMNNGG